MNRAEATPGDRAQPRAWAHSTPPVEQTVATRVLSVLASAAIAVTGLWVGLAAVGQAAELDLATLLATTVTLLVAEAAARPLLRRLAGRGSALLAIVVGLAGQLVIALLALYLVAGVKLDRWSDIAVVLGVMALITAIGRWLVGASDAAYVVGHALRRGGARRGDLGGPPAKGLVVMQFDGVSGEVLRRAIASGQVPTVARWLRQGTHVLRDWWVPVPSTTPASHAGLLHGDDTQVPGFRWWDRRLGRLMVSNRPADAAVVETRFPAGRGTLRQGGVAVSSAFTGEADEAYLVFSRATSRRGLGHGSSFVPLFASPFLLPRTLLLTVGEMVKEAYQARRQKVRGVEPRIPRKLSYLALRGITNVLLRTLNLVIVTDAMSRGAPVVFVDFVDYDEIAHHAGPERPEAMRALEGLDAVLGELARAANQVPTEYEFVVWSDHGQSIGPTFEQLGGITLAARVEQLMAGDVVNTLESANGDDWGPLNALIASTLSGAGGGPGGLAVGPDRRAGATNGDAPPDVVVVGGGNLGMVWFPAFAIRPTLAEIDARWPGLVPGLALTPGVGLVMVADGGDGPAVDGGDGGDGGVGGAVAVGPLGVHRLDTGEVSGLDPLAPFGGRAAGDLLRLSSTEHCGDLVLLSTVDPDGTVHAFEGQVGSHGGVGGLQSHGMLLHPAALPADADLLTDVDGVGVFTNSVAIHDQLERWRRAQGTLSDGS